MILSIVSAMLSVPLFTLSLLSAMVNGMAANHFRLPVCFSLSLTLSLSLSLIECACFTYLLTYLLHYCDLLSLFCRRQAPDNNELLSRLPWTAWSCVLSSPLSLLFTLNSLNTQLHVNITVQLERVVDYELITNAHKIQK